MKPIAARTSLSFDVPLADSGALDLERFAGELPGASAEIELSDLERVVTGAVRRAMTPLPLANTRRLTAREVARELRCSERHVRQLIALKTLRVEREGRRIFVPRRVLDAYVASLAPRQ